MTQIIVFCQAGLPVHSSRWPTPSSVKYLCTATTDPKHCSSVKYLCTATTDPKHRSSVKYLCTATTDPHYHSSVKQAYLFTVPTGPRHHLSSTCVQLPVPLTQNIILLSSTCVQLPLTQNNILLSSTCVHLLTHTIILLLNRPTCSVPTGPRHHLSSTCVHLPLTKPSFFCQYLCSSQWPKSSSFVKQAYLCTVHADPHHHHLSSTCVQLPLTQNIVLLSSTCVQLPLTQNIVLSSTCVHLLLTHTIILLSNRPTCSQFPLTQAITCQVPVYSSHWPKPSSSVKYLCTPPIDQTIILLSNTCAVPMTQTIFWVCTEKTFKIHKRFRNLFTTAKPQYDAQIWCGKATQRYVTLPHIQ